MSEKSTRRSPGAVEAWPARRRIGQVMRGGAVVVRRDERLVSAMAALRLQGARYAVVMNGGQIEGVLAERDLDALVWMIRGSVTRTGSWMTELVVEDVMRTPPVILAPDVSVAHAGRLMQAAARDCVVVMSEGRPVGVVTREDLPGGAAEPPPTVPPPAASGASARRQP